MADRNTVNWRANGKDGISRRTPLKNVLPLDTPLTLNIEASGACCLQCEYCPQSLPENRKSALGIGQGIMRWDTFSRLVEQCKAFPQKIKTIRFAGFGEPLLNPRIDEMVKLAKKSGIAEKVTIFTNGIPMTKELAERLACADVDTMLFDIQGLSNEDYLNVANTKIDYERLIENIKYLHLLPTWKGRIFIKTFKYIVEGREEEYFRMFENISDDVSIDDIYEQCKELNFNGMLTKESSKFGFTSTNYCANPWFHLSISVDGNVHVCPAPVSYGCIELQLGNIMEDSILSMWEGTQIFKIRKMLLDCHARIKECAECDYVNNIPLEDRIDEIVDRLRGYCDERLGIML